jgi:hypothetical protein
MQPVAGVDPRLSPSACARRPRDSCVEPILQSLLERRLSALGLTPPSGSVTDDGIPLAGESAARLQGRRLREADQDRRHPAPTTVSRTLLGSA